MGVFFGNVVQEEREREKKEKKEQKKEESFQWSNLLKEVSLGGVLIKYWVV